MRRKTGKNEQKKTQTVNIGLSSMIVILIGLSFMVMAALSVSHAQNDLSLTRRMAEHNTAYYQAVNKAYEKISEQGTGKVAFEVPVEEGQVLKVEGEVASDGKFEASVFTVVNRDVMELEESIPVFTLEE